MRANSTIQRLKRKLALIRAEVGKAKLAKLPVELQHHASTGEEPTNELTKVYVRLTKAATQAMDSSIGQTEDHKKACTEYEQALADWRRVLKEAGL